MLRDQCRLETLVEGLELVEVVLTEGIRGAQREADAVEAQGIVGSDALQKVQGLAPGAEVVLAVAFDPSNRRSSFEDPPIMD